MAEYIKRMDTFSDEMCEGIDCGVCPFYNKAGENDCQVVAFLRSIPAADVRPVVKAHWYWDKDGMDWGIGAWRCSACKAMSPMWWNADRGSPMHKSGHYYCPNCGADMREEN